MSGPRRCRKRVTVQIAIGLLLAGLLGLCLFNGCAGGMRRATEQPQLMSSEERGQAERLFRRLEQEHSLQRDRQALQLAYELIDRFGLFERNDQVMLLGARSAERLGDLMVGRQLTAEFLARYPTSPFTNEVLSLGARLAAAAADSFAAVDLLVRLYDRISPQAEADTVATAASAVVSGLTAEEVGRLVIRYPRSGLRPYLSYRHAQILVTAGRLPEARQSVAALRLVAPASRYLAAAEELLAGRQDGDDRVDSPGTSVGPLTVGILCPLTGRYTVLGNAFYDGALMAQKAFMAAGGPQIDLKVEDTESDPVAAAAAARRLAQQEGVVAIVGALLSAPTVAAALVADQYGVPLVSPTATNERVWQIGPGIFQTNSTELSEVRLLARLATRVMLKKRFAILYADTRDGERSLQIMTEQISDCGGEVVASVAFKPEETDFRLPLLAIKQGRPEVVFVQASVDQMILLGPQFDFYRVGALVMGFSSWNSPKLLREAGAIMERAVFPSDVALFPEAWTEGFQTSWDAGQLPDEATPIALRAYQATLLIMDTLAQEQVTGRAGLAEALRGRMATQEIESIALADMTQMVRIIRDGQIAPFPTELFADNWPPSVAAPDSAVADSLMQEMPEAPEAPTSVRTDS